MSNVIDKENLPLQVIQLHVNNDKSVIDAINRIAKEKDRIDVILDGRWTQESMKKGHKLREIVLRYKKRGYSFPIILTEKTQNIGTYLKI
jgi:hypothetical protein